MLLLGSATPDVVSRYCAETGRYHYFTLPDRFNARKLPDVIIADMKQELRNGNSGSISSVLYAELEENLRRGEQSILFLNRRGASKLVTCAECGATYSCPNCSVSLTYHQGNQMLVSHHCGYRQRVDDRCPACGGELRFLGDGTERIEADVHALFPGVETLRMDADAIAMAGTHEVLLQRFARERIPIMIGTQMITKGLNFENVTLVGVLNADQSLYVGDYRANERTFSLITQVVGRSARPRRDPDIHTRKRDHPSGRTAGLRCVLPLGDRAAAAQRHAAVQRSAGRHGLRCAGECGRALLRLYPRLLPADRR